MVRFGPGSGLDLVMEENVIRRLNESLKFQSDGMASRNL